MWRRFRPLRDILSSISTAWAARRCARRNTTGKCLRRQGARAVVNVPSLRLDAVLAQTLRLARAKAQTLIRGGAVNRNWAEETRPDVELAEGDVISVRGHGRVKIHAVQGESRKGRLFIEVETFLKP